MTNKLQTAAVAFLIFLSTLCSAQDYTTNRLAVKSVNYGAQSATVDIGPFFPETGVVGMHGDVIGCNNDEASCYAPNVGESGNLVGGPIIYANFPNITIKWDNGNVATYALHQEY